MTQDSGLKIAVLDDWQSVAENVVDWTVLQPIGEVSFLHDTLLTQTSWSPASRTSRSSA